MSALCSEHEASYQELVNLPPQLNTRSCSHRVHTNKAERAHAPFGLSANYLSRAWLTSPSEISAYFCWVIGISALYSYNC